jgi:hypothetical protein
LIKPKPIASILLLQLAAAKIDPEHAGFAKAKCRAEQRRTSIFNRLLNCYRYYKQSKEKGSAHFQNTDNGIHRGTFQRYNNGTYLATIHPTLYNSSTNLSSNFIKEC